MSQLLGTAPVVCARIPVSSLSNELWVGRLLVVSGRDADALSKILWPTEKLPILIMQGVVAKGGMEYVVV